MVLHRSVSGITSAVNTSLSLAATVRHTPLTATDSPRRRSMTTLDRSESLASSVSASSATTVPTASTMPVNTGSALVPDRSRHDAQVRPDALDLVDAKLPGLVDARGSFATEGRQPATADEHWRNVADHAVDQVGPQERHRERRPTLEQDVHDAAIVENAEHCMQVELPVNDWEVCPGQHQRRGGVVEHCGVGRRTTRGVDDHAE